MISMSWTTPAGFAGPGVDVRPYAADCAVVRPDLGGAVVPVQGTGVPTAGRSVSGTALRHRGTGLFATGMPTAKQLAPTTPQFDQIPQNDGTTLGYHPSRRPTS